jgi:nicotinamide riboside kinase
MARRRETWPRPAKIAFIGSHGIRKTSALLAFAAVVQRAGRSVELGREVVRDNPLGINESATGEAQLWVLMSQIRQELELATKAQVLVTDRAAMDNHAYYLRACGDVDRFAVTPLVTAWARTYDLVVRLLPDIPLRADGTRSTADEFRDEVEAILDATLPSMVSPARLVTMPASGVRDDSDWWPVAERLAAQVGQPLPAPGVEPPRQRSAPKPRRPRAATVPVPQLALDLDEAGS